MYIICNFAAPLSHQRPLVMKLSYIPLHIGDHEAMFLCKLLRRHIKELETEAGTKLGHEMNPYQESDWNMATDMLDFLQRMLDRPDNKGNVSAYIDAIRVSERRSVCTV